MERIILRDGVEYSYEPVSPGIDILEAEIRERVATSGSKSTWVHVSIPHFLWDMAKKYQYDVDAVKEWLLGHKNRNFKHTIFSGTSTAFIDIKTSYPARDHIIRRLYVHIPGKGYQSHIGIEKKLYEEARS